MNESEPNARKRTNRPGYVALGGYTDGASHIYRTTDETVHIVQNGQRVQKFAPNGRSVDDYVTFIRDKDERRGWENCHHIADDDPFAAPVKDIAQEVAA